MEEIKLGVFISLFGSLITDAPVDPPPTYAHVLQTARLAEYYGFNSLWATDHLLNTKLGENSPTLESWTILSALAAVTTKIKIGHAVMCQAFRNPAVLAKMVATIDDISKGRFIFALGGGNFQREFEAFGLEWDTHDHLIERGEEQLVLLKRLWTEDFVTFEGKYYRFKACSIEPKPVQKPYPLICWGGTSEASQKVAARHADIWFMKDSSVEQAEANINSIQRFLNGRKIEYGIGCILVMGDTDEIARNNLAGFVKENEKFSREIIETGLVGSPETIARKIHQYARVGLDYVLLKPAPTISTLINFGEKTLPLLRKIIHNSDK